MYIQDSQLPINLCELVNLFNRVPFVGHCLAHGQPSAICGVFQFIVEVVVELLFLIGAAIHSVIFRVNLRRLARRTIFDTGREYCVARLLTYHANGLLQTFLESTSNGHYFSDRLHCCPNVPTNELEFGEIPSRDLDNDVIQAWFEVSERY